MAEAPTTVIHDVGDGCPDDSAEHWRDLHGAATRQASQYLQQVQLMRAERKQWEQTTRADAQRQAWDYALASSSWGVTREATAEFSYLASRLERLPEAPKGKDLLFVRDAAGDLRRKLSRFEAERPGGLLAEVRRLRDALYDAGRRLHQRFGTTGTGEYCWCPGCDMTRAVEVADPTKEEINA